MLLVFEFGTLNGGENSLLAVLPQFVGTEFEFVALAPARGPLSAALKALGVPTIPFEVRDASGQRRPPESIVAEFHAAIRRARPEVIHANSLAMGRLTGVMAPESGAVCTAHLRDIIRLTASAVALLNANRALIAVSNAVRDFHVAQGVTGPLVQVVYNGIDCGGIPTKSLTGELKKELRLASDTFLVATIGQIALRKGQDVFARAAVLAASQMPNVHFLLIGERYSEKAESIAYEESIVREFSAAGLSDRFHLLGYRTDVMRLLGEIDLVVHTARQEPFGRVLLEAAAAARPIIATAVGGTEEMLVNEESALLLPSNSPDSLSIAMVRLYDDAALRGRLGMAAQSRIASLFSTEESARNLAEVWRRSMNQ